MMQYLLGTAFAAFAVFAVLACYYQLVTGHQDGQAARNAEDTETRILAQERRGNAVKNARRCSIAAGVCLLAALACGVLLRLS